MIWACKEEFLSSEYLDKDAMYCLLRPAELYAAYLDYHARDDLT